MSDYKAKNYIDNGILDFILDLCSPEQWHPEKLKKENIPLLTPVERIYPPITEPPYSFKDYILGSTKNPKTIYFPSNKDGTQKNWNGEQDTRIKAIEELNAYAKHYNERVEEIWKKDGANDLESQHNHPLFKVDDTPISPYSLIFTVYQHHYRQKNESPQKGDPLVRHVTNQLLWKIFKTNTKGVDVALIINKTIFDYMVLVTTERELKEGDLYYYPMREFIRYAEKEGFDYDDIPNALDTMVERSSLDEKNDSPLSPVLSEDNTPAKFKININRDLTKIQFTKGINHYTQYLSAKELGMPPSHFRLLKRYGDFYSLLIKDEDGDMDKLWRDTILWDGKNPLQFQTVVRYQRFINGWFKVHLEVKESIFLRMDANVGEGMMRSDVRFGESIYKCKILIRFEAQMDRLLMDKGITSKEEKEKWMLE